MLGRHSGIGNRIPRFPDFWGDFPIPDSRSAGNRESGNGPFPDRPGTGNRGPDSASRGFPGLGDTPSRDEVLRQNAADRMEDELDAALKWAVVVAVPKEVRELSAAEESEREETRMARRGPLFEDQNFQTVPEH